MKKYTYLLFFTFLATSLLAQNEADLLSIWHDPSIPGSTFYDNAYNEVWGLTINDREIGIIGTTLGTHFIDVTDPENPVELEDLFIAGAAQGGNIIHRDYHDYNGYLYAVCDEGNSTFQVIDIRDIPNSVEVVYESSSTLSKSHNIFIDAATGKLYACGVRKGTGGSFIPLQVYCLEDPANPEYLGDITQIGNFPLPYAHDIFVENDTAFLNCANSGLYAVDFSDVDNPELIGSLTSYPQQGYNHSGWMHPNRQYYYLADENHGRDIKVVDISDLANMDVVTTFNASSTSSLSIPHNLIVRCDKLYVSYYYDGLQVYDLADPANPQRMSYYSTTDLPNIGSYEGAWGVYPFLESGNILVSDMQNGLFVFDNLDSGCDVQFTTLGTATCGEAVVSAKEVGAPIGFESKVFPNPNPGFFTLELSLKQTEALLTVELMDLSGKVIQYFEFQNLPNGKEVLNLQLHDSVENGLYVLKINGAQLNETHRIVVSK